MGKSEAIRITLYPAGLSTFCSREVLSTAHSEARSLYVLDLMIRYCLTRSTSDIGLSGAAVAISRLKLSVVP